MCEFSEGKPRQTLRFDIDCGKQGIAWLRMYHPIQNLPAGATPAKPLKPAWHMTYCHVQHLLLILFTIILQVKFWFLSRFKKVVE
jgi:hypothetical protein